MKPTGVLLAIVCAGAALWGTVSLGRYRMPVAPVTTSAAISEDRIGPKVSAQGPHPKIEAPETEFNFGILSVGDKGSHTFTVKNVGEAPLELLARKEDTTCQCTFGELSKDGKIAPGESVEVTLNWEVKVMVEEFRHSATIRSNDPDKRKLELVVTGKVDEPVRLEPSLVWELGQLSGTDPTKMTGAIVSKVLAFDIIKATPSTPLVTATWEPIPEEELKVRQALSGYNLTVAVSPDAPVGPFVESVELELSNEKKPSATVKLEGKRPGPIEFFGPFYRSELNALLMGEFPAANGKETTVFIMSRDFDGELELTKVDQRHNSLKVEFLKDPKSKADRPRYLLKVQVPPGDSIDRRRKNSEHLDLHFNHPGAPVVRLVVDYHAT
jgi:hypothetical protein